MGGTVHSKVETNRAVPFGSRLASRVLVFAAALLSGLALVGWLDWTALRQLRQLNAELSTVRAERFYLGLNLRAVVWQLDGRLLRFQLSEDFSERDAFLESARALSTRLESSLPHLTTGQERLLAEQAQREFAEYVRSATPLLDRGLRGIRKDTTARLAGEIAGRSAAVLRTSEALIQAQEQAWQAVVAESQQALDRLATLMHGSAALLLVVVSLVAVLAYRAFVQPLRLKLDQSRAVLEQQEKLASLGTFAAGVAHEIRNPLAAIKFHLFSLRNAAPPTVANGEDAQVIASEIQRLERIVKEFLEFARPADPRMEPVSSGTLLNEVAGLVRQQLAKQSIELTVEAEDVSIVCVDREQIKQVLLNLVQNARESLGKGGGITLRTRQGAGQLGTRNVPIAILEVSDNGPGIPPELDGKLFDPFVTTKEGGTGLGLSIAARIIEKHGGTIQYQSVRNKGTSFSIVLPRHQDDGNKNSAG